MQKITHWTVLKLPLGAGFWESNGLPVIQKKFYRRGEESEIKFSPIAVVANYEFFIPLLKCLDDSEPKNASHRPCNSPSPWGDGELFSAAGTN